jgi:hypothetical protein
MPALTPDLILSILTLGIDAARAIVRAISAGEPDTAKALAQQLPTADQQAIEDHALQAQQHARFQQKDKP